MMRTQRGRTQRGQSTDLPTTARGENESARSFSSRKATVGNLLAMYLGRMCTFRQGVMPEHLKIFPSELHEEYKRRSMAVLACPTYEDLLKTPLFNGRAAMGTDPIDTRLNTCKLAHLGKRRFARCGSTPSRGWARFQIGQPCLSNFWAWSIACGYDIICLVRGEKSRGWMASAV